jgi:hypothetical protein
MAKQGFSLETTEEVSQDKSNEIDALALDPSTIKYEINTFGDFSADDLPPLPVGIFLTVDDITTRLRDIKIKDGVNTGDFDLFLAELDPQEGENVKKTVDTLSNFLGGGRSPKSGYHLGAIESIGGIPIKDLAQQLNYSSASEMVSNMYLGDVATLTFAVRFKTAGRDVAVDRTCPFPNCKERCRSIAKIDDIEMKSFEDIVTKPLIRYILKDGIKSPKFNVNTFYLEPLKFRQLGLFMGGGRIADIEMLKAMVAEIPELPQKKGKPFTDDLYRFMTQDDIEGVREIAAQIQPGPTAALPVICSCGQEEFQHQLNWARSPRDFLYKTKKLIELTADEQSI